ncbi:MAG: hypothetical protein ACREEJ_22070, partial [Ensifer adhaerens]
MPSVSAALIERIATLKRAAISGIRFLRFNFLFLRMSLSQNRCALFARHALVHAQPIADAADRLQPNW